MPLAEEPTRLVLIRHGQTDWNVGARIQGHTDEPLNAHGRWQAAQLALALAHEDFEAVYCSDLQRARATALAISHLAARRGARPLIDVPGLRERHFGDFEGATFTQVDEQWPEQAARWRQRDPHFAPPGGEALAPFYARVVASAHELASRHAGTAIVLVSHGGVLDCLYRVALGLPLDAPRSWSLHNATINRMLHTARGFTLVGWNDDAHLVTGAHSG